MLVVFLYKKKQKWKESLDIKLEQGVGPVWFLLFKTKIQVKIFLAELCF